jgi:hypothetical protein
VGADHLYIQLRLPSSYLERIEFALKFAHQLGQEGKKKLLELVSLITP